MTLHNLDLTRISRAMNDPDAIVRREPDHRSFDELATSRKVAAFFMVSIAALIMLSVFGLGVWVVFS